MHTLSACGTSPQLLSLPVPGGFGKPGCLTQRTKAFATVFGGVDFAFGETEIVADLVPNGIGDDAFELGRVASHLFVGALKNPDAIGAFEHGVGGGTLGYRPALVETEQVWRRPNGLHDDDEIAHAGAEAAGNIGDGAFHNRVEGFGCEP